MEQVYAEIELINVEDLGDARRGYIDNDEVKRVWVKVLVDTGSMMLAINEEIQEQMQFSISEERKSSQLADGSFISCAIANSVIVKFDNRETTCRAMILPGDATPLLGVIPLEDMDVMIDPFRHKLIVNPAHPDMAVLRI